MMKMEVLNIKSSKSPLSRRLVCNIFALCTLFLFGCGEEGVNFSDSQTVQIDFGDFILEYYLPENWKRHKYDSENGFIGASLGAENFVITQHKLPEGEVADITRYFLDKSKGEFFHFEEISFAEDEWVFRAKKVADSPLREFRQNMVIIPNMNAFLLGSCSFEVMVNDSADCEDLLGGFRLVEKGV